MRHQTFEVRRRGLHRARDLLGAGARPQAAHAAIDLQVIGNARGRQILQRMNHRREMEFFQAGSLLRKKIGHHQDAGADPLAAQIDAFLDVRYGQPFGALGFERARYFRRRRGDRRRL